MPDLLERFAGLPAEQQARILQQVEGRLAAPTAMRVPNGDRFSPQPMPEILWPWWFFEQVHGGAANIPQLLHAHLPFEREVADRVFGTFARSHEAMRTTFPLVAGLPVLQVHPELPIEVRIVDLSALHAARREQEALRLATDSAWRPFDIQRGPLWRVTAYRLAPNEHLIELTISHLVMDAVAIGIMRDEILSLLGDVQQGRTTALPDSLLSPIDVAAWQRCWLATSAARRQLDYWRHQLKDAPPFTPLPYDHRREPTMGFEVASGCSILSPDRVVALSERVQTFGVTLPALLLTAYQVLLGRWTGADDLVLGIMAHGRSHQSLRPVVGCLVNFVPLRLRLAPSSSTRAAIVTTGEQLVHALDHADIPFATLVAALNPTRSAMRHACFNVAFDYRFNLPVGASGPVQPYAKGQLKTQVTEMDLALFVDRVDDAMRLEIEYNTHRFEASTIRWLLDAYQAILAEMTGTRPEAPLALTPLGRARSSPAPITAEEPVPADRRLLLEPVVSQAWEEALGIVSPPREANFFALGGTSIRAVRLAARLTDSLRRRIPISLVMIEQTIRDQAEAIARLER